MIPYSLNNEVRKTATVFLVLISICITVVMENVVMKYFNNFSCEGEFFNNISSLIEYKLLIALTIPPFVVWCILNFIYSKWIWKLPCCQPFHKIPNLNGKWHGYTINDKNPNQKRNVLVTIKQDWNNIQVKTEIIDSNNPGVTQSFCECTVAAIDVNSGKITLKYVYKNGLLADRSYIGYNELVVEKNEITGQYMTSKPTKGIFRITR